MTTKSWLYRWSYKMCLLHFPSKSDFGNPSVFFLHVFWKTTFWGCGERPDVTQSTVSKTVKALEKNHRSHPVVLSLSFFIQMEGSFVPLCRLFNNSNKQNSCMFNLKSDKRWTYTTRIIIFEDNLQWFACTGLCWCSFSGKCVVLYTGAFNAWWFVFTPTCRILNIWNYWFCDWTTDNWVFTIWSVK